MEIKKFDVKCPECSVAGKIDVPSYLFLNKKTGTLKVQVNVGMVCEQEFVVFISRSGEIMGYEKIDVALNLADLQQSSDQGHIFLPDILKIFKIYGVSNQLHAILLNAPIKVFRCADDFNYAKPLTTLFNEFLPPTYKDQMIIVSNILEKDFKNAKIKDVFVFDTSGSVVNTPWDDIDLKIEEGLILESLKFLDPKMQLAYIQERLAGIFSHAAFIAKKVQKSQMFEVDVLKALNMQFFREFDKNYFGLLKQVAIFRFGAKANKIVNKNLSKLKESLW